jgi:hypothetical protein
MTADTATAGAGAAVAGTEGAGTAAALRASDGSPRWATATGDPSSSRRTFEEPMDVAAAGNATCASCGFAARAATALAPSSLPVTYAQPTQAATKARNPATAPIIADFII